MRYKILNHQADLKIKFFGKDKKEFFESAMIGMQSFLRPKTAKEKKKSKRKIRIRSADIESLLVDFLSEVNYLNEVNGEVYKGLKFNKFSDTELEGELSGEKVKSFGFVIKGVTYHNLDIRQKEDKIWEATVVFDI